MRMRSRRPSFEGQIVRSGLAVNNLDKLRTLVKYERANNESVGNTTHGPKRISSDVQNNKDRRPGTGDP